MHGHFRQGFSNTAGGISSSAGTTEKIIGWSKSTTNLYFDPFHGELPTAKEKDAIAKLVAGTHLYAADAGASDTYAITLAPVPAAYTAGMAVLS